MENEGYVPPMRPDHWRLDLLEGQIERLYDRREPFFVAEVERRNRERIWLPEEDLDVEPDPDEQRARADGLWLFNDPDLLCEGLIKLEKHEFDVTEVLIVSPPALNGSDEWRCERLKALFGLRDEYGIEGGWLYIVGSGEIYGLLDPICYVADGSARSMVLRDPRTQPTHRPLYVPLPKFRSIAAIGQHTGPVATVSARKIGEEGRGHAA